MDRSIASLTKVLEGFKSHIRAFSACKHFFFMLLLLLLLFFGQFTEKGVRRGRDKEEDEDPQEQSHGPQKGCWATHDALLFA